MRATTRWPAQPPSPTDQSLPTPSTWTSSPRSSRIWSPLSQWITRPPAPPVQGVVVPPQLREAGKPPLPLHRFCTRATRKRAACWTSTARRGSSASSSTRTGRSPPPYLRANSPCAGQLLRHHSPGHFHVRHGPLFTRPAFPAVRQGEEDGPRDCQVAGRERGLSRLPALSARHRPKRPPRRDCRSPPLARWSDQRDAHEDCSGPGLLRHPKDEGAV